MKQAIGFCLLTLAGVILAAPSDHPCPVNEVFRPDGGPGCENCGPRCLVFNTEAKCYCKSGYSRVNGNCIPNEECPPRQTPKAAMENPELYNGDMLDVEVDDDRNAVTSDYQLWPGRVVPYEFEHGFDGRQLNATVYAMKHIEEKTCIKFVKRTVQKDFVRIIHSHGCFSHWGRKGGRQFLSLGDGCGYLGIAIHELMHAIGFEHEHTRPDRDDYVIIYWDNIDPEKYHNFKKYLPKQNRLLTPFDYDSIMLYGSKVFIDYPGLLSMVKKDGTMIPEVYEKFAMSPADIERVKILYQCPD